MSEQFDPADQLLFGAAAIARALNKYNKKKKPDVNWVYNKFEAGLLDGLVVKNGRGLISNLRQLRQIATQSIKPKK